jgi:hypothetical protein
MQIASGMEAGVAVDRVLNLNDVKVVS